MSVALDTTFGTLTVTLHHREAPKTCRNFVELCKCGYYDGVLFHRIVPDFMCQTGDPYGDGTGGESIYGPTFEDEISARLSHDRMGVVSMANAGRHTNSSQFFCTFRAAPHLDGKHTIFGEITEDSVATLTEFMTVKTKNKKPVKPIKIYSARVLEDPYAGQPLPPGASLPEKPLVQTSNQKCLVQ